MPLPADFPIRRLGIEYVEALELMRIFRNPVGTHPNPLRYGNLSKNRFDPPPAATGPDRFGVTYAAFDLPTSFAETVTREDNRKPLQFGGIVVSESAQVHTRYVAELQAQMRLRLADVTDVALYALGAEAGEFNSANYTNDTQPWALELFKRPETVDGLLYRSRFLNGRLAVAIFERGGSRVSLGVANVTRLDRHGEYPKALKELNVTLLP